LRHAINGGATVGIFVADIGPIATPEYCDPDATRALTEALDCADFILTGSEYSKSSLLRHMGPPAASKPVHVLRCGHGFSLPAPADTKINPAIAEILETDYVLCAGAIEARRNPTYLFNIWKVMTKSGRPDIPYLVFAGPQGHLVDDFLYQLKACHFLGGRILLVHQATDAERDALYRNCILTACPSFADGLGLPVGESLAHGKICICSSEGSLPEVGGELADYVDPYNVQDGLQRLLRYLDDSELRRNREREIAGQFRVRSWRQMTDDLLASIPGRGRTARQ
jgi:glycosyltransferase involved in cell wall biosynthesis